MGGKDSKQKLPNKKELEEKEVHQVKVKPTVENFIHLTSNVFISEQKSNPDQDYAKLKFLGEGSFAAVHKAKHKLTGAIRAMKVIKKSTSCSNEEDQEIINEINVLKKMDHPNILKIFEFYSCKDTYQLVTEFCTGGELFQEIVSKGPFSEETASYIMYQLFSSINYCHNMSIIHRDLKPENILIEKREGKDFLRIKVSDFGTSKMFEHGSVQRKVVGSSYYIAPEVLQKKYNEKCDLWSCGVILYILLSGRPPFAGEDDASIIERVKTGKYELSKSPWNEVSDNAKQLIKSLLTMDPEKRINAEAALNHNWFIKNKSRAKFNEIKDNNMICDFIANLKEYKTESVIQETALAYLVHNYPQLETVVNACKLFNQIDVSGDGKINQEELYKGLSKRIQSDSLKDDVAIIFKNMDSDNNGYIEYEEFVRAAITKDIFLAENVLRFAFRYFDKDNSGAITLEEIEEVFKSSVAKECDVKYSLKKIISEVDLNGDGKIEFEEFAYIMRKLLKKKDEGD